MPQDKDQREFLGDVWCDLCKCPIGFVYRIREGNRWAVLTRPACLPKYCPYCDQPIDKKVVTDASHPS